VLAGKILPDLNMAICWKLLFYTQHNLAQSAGNLGGLSLLEISRDYTPEFFCCGFFFNILLCKIVVKRFFKRTMFTISSPSPEAEY
jgi:small basic protein